MKLHLGCGPHFLEDWTNVDYSFGAKIARIPVIGRLSRALGLFKIQWNPRIVLHDLTEPLPWPDASADFIYSSHTLEHLRREDGARLIGDCHRVLKPGGVLRIVVPDLRSCVDAYTSGSVPCEEFVESLMVLASKGASWKQKLLGALDDGHLHKCMYDTPGLVRILTKAGFSAKGMDGQDSLIPDIREVEKLDRTRNAVVVEGVK
jgi:predicted SAM-dependent methyltransferase